ncbi:hypothetical protein N7530_000777 [Penicillium desertorum]|uniref:Uncharacterized protein n=1 Tax=Penicillium desertorum TaxID=1303715 RepID=A0A9W9X8W9_9EURO|nr:hypothetical protein N7530_000777 [Penicillium desertorum]
MVNLHPLIDPRQNRPYRDDGNYALWLRLTQQVRAWLGSCIGPGLGLAAKDHGVRYADEFMRQLKVHMKRRRRPIIQKACFDVWDVWLEDFLTIGEFVAALKQRLHSAIDLEYNILPYHASIVMLWQLKTLEIMYLEARANSAVDTTMPDFYDTCTAMLNYVEDKGLSSERVTDLVSVVSTD